MSSECTICGVKTEHIEIHHKIPQRFNGPNEFWNLEGLCRSCHVAIEKMYNKKFWDYVGFVKEGDKNVCEQTSCGATDTRRAKVVSPKVGLMNERHGYYCHTHMRCYRKGCGHEGEILDRIVWDETDDFGFIAQPSTIIACPDHRVCSYPGCESRHTILINKAGEFFRTGQFLCYQHLDYGRRIKMSKLVRVAKHQQFVWEMAE